MRADFLLLLKDHLAFLLGYVRSLGFKRPDVEDIVQETLAGAYQNLDRFDPGRGDVRVWLAGIAENQAKSFRARAYHRHEVTRDPGSLTEIADEGPASDAAAIAKDHQRTLEELLADIPRERLTVLLAHEILEMDLEEIATELDLPFSLVRTRYRLAQRDAERIKARWQAVQLRRRLDVVPFALALVLAGRRAWAASAAAARRTLRRPAGRAFLIVGLVVALTIGVAGELGREPHAVVTAAAAIAAPVRDIEAVDTTTAVAPATSGAARTAVQDPPREKPRSRALRAPAEIDAELSAEQILMDRARAAVATANIAEALILFERHRSDHPDGQYAAERDAYLKLLRAPTK